MVATIKELVNEYRNKVFNPALEGEGADAIMKELASLLGNINDEIRQRHKQYINSLSRFLQDPKMSITKARLLSQGTDEWDALQEAKDLKEVAHEMIGTLKYYSRSKREEKQISGMM